MTPPSKDMLARECKYGRTGFLRTMAYAGWDRWSSLTSRSLGDVVTDHRSSWVRRIRVGPNIYFVKTYDYPTPRDRRRGWLRTTWLKPSRATREAQALAWLRGHGFQAPEPLYHGDDRRGPLGGVLRRAVLVTADWDGTPLDRLAPTLGDRDRADLQETVIAEVQRLHRAGFRHRNLDPRNVLVRHAGSETTAPIIAFLDAPRFRLRPPTQPGQPDPTDRHARGDWSRLRVAWRGHGPD